MTERELRKLSRSDLLEMMLTVTRENEQLRQLLTQAQEQLTSRRLTIENAGSLAEASMQLNGVFEAAQAACEMYTENIRQRSEQQEATCAQLEKETRERCDRMLAEARQQADEYWADVQSKVQKLYDENIWLRDLPEADLQLPGQE